MTGNTSKDQCLTPWSSISGKAEKIEVKNKTNVGLRTAATVNFVKYSKTAI